MTGWRLREFHNDDLDGILHLWEAQRQSSAIAKNTTQPWSCAARPTAAPMTSSACTATTAWSIWQDAMTSLRS